MIKRRLYVYPTQKVTSRIFYPKNLVIFGVGNNVKIEDSIVYAVYSQKSHHRNNQ